MKKKWWIPIIAISLFGLESIFSNFFPTHLLSEEWIVVPRFLFTFFLFLAVYYDEKMAYIYAFLFGLLTDIVFTEILGVYLFWYPAVVYLTAKLMKILHNHLVIMAFITLLAISFLDFGIYAFMYILRITAFSPEKFLLFRLLPTLSLNFIVFLFFSYPAKKYLNISRKFKEEEEGMF